MIDIAEGATGALQIISRDRSARDKIRNEKWGFFIQILKKSPLFQRYSCGLCYSYYRSWKFATVSCRIFMRNVRWPVVPGNYLSRKSAWRSFKRKGYQAQFNPQAPVAQKLRMRWFFDVSKVKESNYLKSDLTEPPQIFDAHLLENTNLGPSSFHFQWV